VDYEITGVPDSTLEGGTVVKTFSSYEPPYQIRDLQSGMKYTISAKAKNIYITSVKSADISYNTLLPPPRNLSVNTITDSTTTISFNTPSSGSITQYTIIATHGSSSMVKENIIVTDSQQSLYSTTIMDLSAGMSYVVSVTAINNYTQSVPLTSNLFYTVLPPPRNLYVNNITDTTIDISFNEPARGLITKYRAFATDATGTIVTKDNITETSATITNLIPGMTYKISVIAFSIGTQSSPLAPDISYNTLLLPPSGLSITNITDTSMNVAFTAPIRGTVTKYNIIARPDSGNDVSFNFNTFQSHYEINGLSSNMPYIISVVASTNYTSSLPLSSGTTKYTTLLPPPTNLNVNIATITDTSMNISFTASPNATVNSYEVTALSTSGNVTQSPSGNTIRTITGLTRDTSYNISVVAKNPDGNRSLALISGLSYRTLLPPPRNLQTTGSTSTSIDIAFDPPIDGITTYTYNVFYVSTIPDSSGNIPNVNQTNYTINNLTSGVFYTIYVNTKNTNGNYSLPISTSNITLLLPPTNIKVTTGFTTIDVSFNETIGQVDKYEITADPTEGMDVSQNFIPPFNPPYVLSGLQSGISYSVYVRAINSIITSNRSDYTNIITKLRPPSSLLVTDISYTAISISFTAPPNATISYYEVTFTSLSGSIIDRSPIYLTSTILTNLQEGMAYTIKVVARTSYTISNPLLSDLSYVTLLPPPTGLIVNTIEATSMNVSFTAPYSGIPFTGTIINYRITATAASGPSVIKDAGNSTSTSISGLISGMLYTVSVVAYTAYTQSIALASTTNAYKTILPPPTNLRQNGSAATTIDISFNPPTGGTITKYTVNTIYNENTVPQVFTVPTSIYRITGLQSGTLYTINMYASTAYTDSVLTSNITYSTILSAPSGLNASNVTATSMKISFTPPAGTVTQYTLSVSPTPSGGFTGIVPGTDTSYNLTGLSGFTTYTISMTATNGIVTSVASNVITPTTIIGPPTSFGASVNVYTVSVSFTKPNGQLDYYVVSAIPNNGTTITQKFVAGTNMSSYNILGYMTADDSALGTSIYEPRGLQPNTLYTLSMVAINNNGTSASSTTAQITTPTLLPPNLSVTSTTGTTIDISFNSQAMTIDTYIVTLTPDGGGTTIRKLIDKTATTYTITSLTSNTTYTITLFSIRGSIMSSISTTGTTPYIPFAINSSVAPQTISEYNIYVFTTVGNNSGSLSISTGDAKTIYYLVVAGGGAGATDSGGGGGGGGVLQGNCTINSSDTITITVGSGGNATYSTYNTDGNGKNSLIVFNNTTSNNQTSIGGGRGAGSVNVGASGGSGGGGAYETSGYSGTSGQGNAGAGPVVNSAGGGGGAGIAATTINGGIGVLCTQLGINSLYSSYYWGGGGGGGNVGGSNIGGNGGDGGGGGGGVRTTNPGSGGSGLNAGSNGTQNAGASGKGGNGGANTGGGGGGGPQFYIGGNGGSGIVIIAIDNTGITLLPPTNLSVTTITPTALTITFTTSLSYIDNYSVTATDNANSANTTTQTINKSLTSYTITNLIPSKTYTIAVVSIFGSNTSVAANVNGTTLTIQPPTSLSVTTITPTSLTITFTASPTSSYLDNYSVTATDNANSANTTTQTINKSSTTYTITNLIPSKTYTISLVSIFGIYQSTTTSTTGTTLTIQPPTSLSVTTITPTALTITFTASPTSSYLDNYNVTATDNANSANTTTQTINKSSTTYEITNLIPSKTYTIALVAKLASYQSTTTSTTGTTLTLQPPTSVSVNTGASTKTSLTITFTASPTSTYIDNYSVTATPTSGGSGTIVQTINKSATTYTITSLTQSTTYNIVVISILGLYQSVNSNTATGTTLSPTIYTNITFPDTYATYVVSSTLGSDVIPNTVKSLTVSGATTYKNGTYIVSSSSAYAGYGSPYFVFCNANTPSSPYWASGGTSATSPLTERTIISTGYQTFSQSGYSNEGVYQGGGSVASTFSTTYNTSLTANGEWIQTQFPYSIQLKTFTFYPRGGSYTLQDRNPKSGVILGSNDGNTWTLIYTYNSGTLTGNTGPYTYTGINAANAYTYIRFVITATYGTTQGNFLSITKIYYTGDIYV
jgi:hypothetical protein